MVRVRSRIRSISHSLAMADNEPTVFFYDQPTPIVVPLDDGYSMTLCAITNRVGHLTVSHETDGANIESHRFQLRCLNDAHLAPAEVPNYRQPGSWMVASHQDYELYYKHVPILRLAAPSCHEIIRI